ncbi:GPI-anchored surface protein, putative, partial [Bodo saltans]
MDVVSYFAFQVERLSRKELAERRQVTNDESVGRSAIEGASLLTWELLPSTQTSHSTIRRFDPIALPSLPPLAAYERSEIVSTMNINASSSHHVVELERNARADIMEWEHQARGAIQRSLSLSVAPRVAAHLTAEEALWRNKIEKSAQHDYKQFHVLQMQTLIFLLQHPQYSGSCYAARREVRRQEIAARWELAIQFCALFHSWEE